MKRTVTCSVCARDLPWSNDFSQYPNLVCSQCDQRAINREGAGAHHDSPGDSGDNPVFIDGVEVLASLPLWGFYHHARHARLRHAHGVLRATR